MKFQEYECWTDAQDPSTQARWTEKAPDACRAAERFIERLWKKGDLSWVAIPGDGQPEDPEVIATVGCVVKGPGGRPRMFAVEIWLDSDGPSYPTFQAFEISAADEAPKISASSR
jgi:hypothetical protein